MSKRKLLIPILSAVAVLVIAALVILIGLPYGKYLHAQALVAGGSYDEGYALLTELGKGEAISKSKYERALGHREKGEYAEAWELLTDLNYADSSELRDALKPLYYGELLKNAEVGASVYFGSYEQDGSTENGKEDIEWTVLEKQNGTLLLISTKALDCRSYNSESAAAVTWETSPLRKWLNGEFFNSAFTAEEQAAIPEQTVRAENNPKFNTDAGNDTLDRVFLLSIGEVKCFFPEEVERRTVPTEYAMMNGAYRNEENGNCWWVLRSPGVYRSSSSSINSNGALYDYGYYLYHPGDAIRPVIRLTVGE